jgi:hypothetical protein
MDTDKLSDLLVSFTDLRELVVSEFGNWSNIDEAGEGLLHGLTRVIRANQQLEVWYLST